MEQITCCELCKHGSQVMSGPRPRPCSFHKPYANFCLWQTIVVERSPCDCERATVLYGKVAFYYVSLANQDSGKEGSRSELHVQECGLRGSKGRSYFYDSLSLLELWYITEKHWRCWDDVNWLGLWEQASDFTRLYEQLYCGKDTKR